MFGNFIYYCPTRMYFGDKAQEKLPDAIKGYGKNVLMAYGGGSIKHNGIYDDVMQGLQSAGKQVTELPGITSNPTLAKFREGIDIARKNDIDLILAVGGGSVIDYAKALSVAIGYDGDAWQHFFLDQVDPEDDQKIIPVGAILTMAGTGSETNATAVITDPSVPVKMGKMFGPEVAPRFAIMNPRYTFSVPRQQMAAGIFDTMCHVMEQYFSGDDDCTTVYLEEGLMRSIVESGRRAAKNPEDYEARSNHMWDATWALNPLMGVGKTADWMAHMMSHAIGAYSHATHGMILSAITPPYYNYILPYGVKRFARFAQVVWDINENGKTEEEVARAGIQALGQWILDIGAETSLSRLGVTEQMLDDIVTLTVSSMNVKPQGYKILEPDEIRSILKQSL